SHETVVVSSSRTPFKVNELQTFATNWLWTYNHERPNIAPGGYMPKQHPAQAAWPLLLSAPKNGENTG
ncbi:hypothetical protein J4G57_20835, partial [Aeromonas caviae]|nr:hypothetical protein [Aeromonas caviae]